MERYHYWLPGFLTNFKNLYLQLNDLQEPGEQAPASHRKTQLKTAVSEFPQLAAVASQDATRIATGEPTLTYQQ